MRKKLLFLVIFLLLIMLLEPISLADGSSKKFDDFCDYWNKTMTDDSSKLSENDIKRMIKGPTTKEKLNGEAARDDSYYEELAEQARNLSESRAQAEKKGDKDFANSNEKEKAEKAKKLRKEIMTLAGKDITQMSTEEIKSYIDKIEDYKINVGREAFYSDTTIVGYLTDLNQELSKRGESPDNDIFEDQVDKDGNIVNGDGSVIYKLPKKDDSQSSQGTSLDDMMSDAENFIGQGNITYKGGLIDVSNTIYNILLPVGVVLAVIVGVIIGIKLMSSGIEQKVEAKKLLIPYVAGCIVIFGGFGIWKLLVTILQSV